MFRGVEAARRDEADPVLHFKSANTGSQLNEVRAAALRGMCAHNGRRRTGSVRDAALE